MNSVYNRLKTFFRSTFLVLLILGCFCAQEAPPGLNFDAITGVLGMLVGGFGYVLSGLALDKDREEGV